MLRTDKIITPRNVLILGAIVSFLVTIMEVTRDRQRNFMIFQNATLDFWNGITPYGEEWFRHGLDFFLYAPLFNIIFTPFAYMPDWLGPFVWNLLNYGLYAAAIYTLPRFTASQKSRILLYTLPILATTQLSFQYNVAIAYIYLFAFTLLERGRAGWAILLIMISALTKIYGGFELAILIFYPRIWRNLGWCVLLGAALLLMPALKIPIIELPAYYGSWIDAINSHTDSRLFEGFFNIRLLWGDIPPAYMPWIQISVVGAVAALVIANYRRFSDFNFRIGVVGIIMGWIILFSNSPEKHTYVIALVGYLMWYWSLNRRSVYDRILYWSNLVVLVLIPVDLLCPPVVMHFIFDTLDLNQWLFLLTWSTMVARVLIQPLWRSTPLTQQLNPQ